jgi:hypothetical protein
VTRPRIPELSELGCFAFPFVVVVTLLALLCNLVGPSDASSADEGS